MVRSFKGSLKKFIEDRVDEIGNKFVIKNKEYKKLADYSTKVHYQIRDNLPDNIKKLIGEYETINTSMQCISEEIMYEQGFIDGIRSNEIIKSIKH
ncbi:MAG TPA: hypothetical protein DDW50_17235 [Firmicutes bacterium]|jgi:hypothetical protein|nr:hypothetical protein [Bacillota bacterium]